jgi:hypothetical protein
MCKSIVVVSGKKGSGKDTLANMIAAAYLNSTSSKALEYRVVDGNLVFGDKGSNAFYRKNLRTVVGNENEIKDASVRIISFATKLKQFCMEVLGLTYQQCYGGNADKNALTHIKWDGLPRWVRVKYAGLGPVMRRIMPRSGYMKAREVLQIFGTEVVRHWHPDAWATAAYCMAIEAKEDIVIIPDCRFPNEVTCSNVVPDNIDVNHIRLLRAPHEDNHPSEHALDDWNQYQFDVVLPPTINLELMQDFANHWLRNHILIHKNFNG